jgi:hypothetical protein
MLRRLGHIEHWGEADVGALEQRTPLLARFRLEDRIELDLQIRPGGTLHVPVEGGIGNSELLAQQRIELRLDRADGDKLTVCGLVDIVEVCAAIEVIDPALELPDAGRRKAIEHAHEACSTVGHGGVHDLPFPGARGLE